MLSTSFHLFVPSDTEDGVNLTNSAIHRVFFSACDFIPVPILTTAVNPEDKRRINDFVNQKASIEDFYGILMASNPHIQSGNEHSIIDVSGTNCVSNELVQVPKGSLMDASEYTL